MPIASVGASLGAELLIEFDTVDVVTIYRELQKYAPQPNGQVLPR
jgi:hypothetical protein